MRTLIEDGALTEQEISQYLANDGKITPEGKSRIDPAIAEKVFRTAAQFYSASEELRNKVACIVRDLVTSAPEWSLLPKVQAAIELIADYDPVKSDSFDQYVQQQPGLPLEATTDPAVNVIAKCLLRLSLTEITNAFSQYAQAESQSRLLEVSKASERAFREAFGPAIEAPSVMVGFFESNSRRTLSPEHERPGAMDLNLLYNVKRVPYVCPGKVEALKPPTGASDADVGFSANAHGNTTAELLMYKHGDDHEDHPRAGLPVAPVIEDVAKEIGLDEGEQQVLTYRALGISRERAIAMQRTRKKKLDLQAAWKRFDRNHKPQVHEALERRKASDPTRPDRWAEFVGSTAPSPARSEPLSARAALQRLADKERAPRRAVTLSKKKRVAETRMGSSVSDEPTQPTMSSVDIAAATARSSAAYRGWRLEEFLNGSARWVRDRQK